jgi:hypothetical protein
VNQELFKLENAVRKAEGAWDRQMKRDGHLKKESRDISNSDSSRMSATARAFYHEYTVSKDLLDREAGHENLFGGTPANPTVLSGVAGSSITVTVDNPGTITIEDPPAMDPKDMHDPEERSVGKIAKGKRAKKTATTYPHPNLVNTGAYDKKIVGPDLYEALRKESVETLMAKKPSAKIHPLGDIKYVVTGIEEHFVVLTRCVPVDDWGDQKIANMEGREPDDFKGLLFGRNGKVKPDWVLHNQGQSIAVLPGDPLASVGLKIETPVTVPQDDEFGDEE